MFSVSSYRENREKTIRTDCLLEKKYGNGMIFIFGDKTEEEHNDAA